MAVAAVVLPTPPLPPKKKYLDEERCEGSVGLGERRVMLQRNSLASFATFVMFRVDSGYFVDRAFRM